MCSGWYGSRPPCPFQTLELSHTASLPPPFRCFLAPGVYWVPSVPGALLISVRLYKRRMRVGPVTAVVFWPWSPVSAALGLKWLQAACALTIGNVGSGKVARVAGFKGSILVPFQIGQPSVTVAVTKYETVEGVGLSCIHCLTPESAPHHDPNTPPVDEHKGFLPGGLITCWKKNFLNKKKRKQCQITLSVHTHRRDHERTQRKAIICKLQKQVSPSANPAGTLFLDFQPPELRKNNFLLSKPHSLWYFVI